MKIPDDVRRTITDVTEKVLEGGRQLGKEAQLQVQIKKLQVEHAKKIHELGKRTYEWYRSGTMVVSGPVPSDVVNICAQLDATQSTLEATQRELTEARIAARQAISKPQSVAPLHASAPSTPPVVNTHDTNRLDEN